ncbi:hypothetical protein BN14_08991 [Rhizoctonia solani AG-1 IB]|uniref:Ams2/SPT21 N-terminal domain-containing protein n=2 Tax=Thanatephorus cucumeris (strain AG1-IB / isolate 7/3/14) TaxID=1108050 RepID=M5CFS2_THACB|nr:hypothetical protein BN14_08991 [Rhizoctonia solani AG-1 IB]
MLARADAVECRAVKSRPNSTLEVKHASTTLKDCLSALCRASPELLADPRTDHSVYALDPLQVPELMVGRGLLTWLMSESGRVVGIVKEDYVDGDELEVLEVKLSLTPTVAVSRAQHATSLHNISNSHPKSANPSPPTTPLTQPTIPQPTRASARLRVRSKKESSATPPPPHQPAKRGRPKKVVAPPLPEPEAQPASPGPSRSHSRVSSISSLALSQAQAPAPSASSQPKTTLSARESIPPPSSGAESERPSPTKTLARLLASSSSSSDPNSRTPLLDSLLERLKSSACASPTPSTEQGTADQPEDSPEAQRQALLALLRLASSANKTNTAPPTPVASGFAAPSPRGFVGLSAGPASLLSNLGVRKRETEDGEIVEIDAGEVKRARVGVGDPRSSTDAGPSPSVPAPLPLTSALSPNASAPSPNISIASPDLSFASPGFAMLSPDLSAMESSAPSPNFPTPSPVISPVVSAASPYPYPKPLGPPRTLTATVSQPNLTFSHTPLQTTSSQPTLPSSQPKRRRQTAQTDLPPCNGSFITPRSQIGQPRPTIPEPVKAPAPGRKAITPAPGPVHPKKSNSVGRPKRPGGREMNEEEVRQMLAGGHYPSGGLQDEHRRLFGAVSRGKKDGDKGSPSAALPAPPSIPEPTADAKPERALVPPLPRSRAPRPREPRPAIPKHSPVAPTVSRLPMMMTSPIRATGVSSNSLPPSFSPLRRLLKNAGVKSVEEVLSKGGVMGLKDEMKREDKREREVVDLTSDADDDDDPEPPSRSTRTPPRTPKPLEAPPTTTPRRSAPIKPSTRPRKAQTSPPAIRTSTSPLFRGQDVPLPPSSPPPMSDSDAGGSVRGENGYSSEGGGYSSETGVGYDGGYDGGVSSDAPPDPDVEMSDTDDEPWDETIRPVERDDGGTGHIGSVLGQMELGLQTEPVNGAGEPHMDADCLSSLLDVLESQGIRASDTAGYETGLGTGGLDQQTLDLARAELDLVNVGLDFSWLDSIGQSEIGAGVDQLVGGPGEERGGMEFDADAMGVGKGGDGNQGLAMSEADLAQLLAAFGSS